MFRFDIFKFQEFISSTISINNLTFTIIITYYIIYNIFYFESDHQFYI